jgi:uncharacterized membrane protein YjgN (DUF898 family)
MAGIVLFVVLLLISIRQQEQFYGPVRGTVFSTGEVMIASHAFLHEFEDGKRGRKISLKYMGVGPVLTELVGLDDGDVLLGDVDNAALKRCSLSTFSCRVLYDGTAGTAGPFSKSFKFVVDRKRKRIFATDAGNHRLLALDLDGGLVASTAISGPDFTFPNDIIIAADGTLALVDTDHSRVAFVDPDAVPFGKVVASFNTRTQFSRFGFTTPIGLAQAADGSFWVVVADNAFQKGDAIQFGAAEPHDALKRADLGDGADPLSLVALPDRVLVMDPSNLRVRSIMPDGSVGADFGGEEFQADLAHTAQRKRLFAGIKLAAQIGLVAMLLLAVWIAKRARDAAKPASSAAPAAPTPPVSPFPSPRRAAAPAAPVAPATMATARIEPVFGLPLSTEPEIRPVATVPAGGRYALEFSAQAGEYFRIWIVNLVLTILTLGIYSAWAKVRKRRYFYGHTKIDGSSFEYRARPIAILKGRLVAVVFVGLVWLSGHFIPGSQLLLLVIGLFAFPWLVVRSMGYNAYNSAYRNIRLHFRGTYGQCLKTVILYGLLTVITLGFGYYVMKARLTEFVARNHYFGVTQFTAQDLKKPLSGVYGRVYLMGFVLGIVVAAFDLRTGSRHGQLLQSPGLTIASYVAYLYIFAFLRAGIANATWNNVTLGEVRFECTMKAGEVFWLYLVNIIAIICSIGLAVPWAVVRTMRYRASRLVLIATEGLEGFIGAESGQISAVGQEVGEMFDLDIGL